MLASEECYEKISHVRGIRVPGTGKKNYFQKCGQGSL